MPGGDYLGGSPMAAALIGLTDDTREVRRLVEAMNEEQLRELVIAISTQHINGERIVIQEANKILR